MDRKSHTQQNVKLKLSYLSIPKFNNCPNEVWEWKYDNISISGASYELYIVRMNVTMIWRTYGVKSKSVFFFDTDVAHVCC